MKKIILFIVLLSTLFACKKEEPEKKTDFSTKIIATDDGKIVVIFDFIAIISNGEESQSLFDWITGFLNRQKEKKTYPEGSYWRIEETMEPVLTTLWDQYEPFYNLCPKLGPNKDLQAPTGCVTCSVAQFLAYNEFPSGLTDYKAIKNIKNCENRFNIGTAEEKQLAAKFIADISTKDLLDVKYVEIAAGITRGYATPLAVVRTLKALGYENVDLHLGLDVERIVSSLKKGNPVIASAAGIGVSHGWVIDGYIKRELVNPEGQVLDTQYLLHFNWGWNGKNNGYFEPGIIDTREPVISDNINPESRDYIFSFAFNTITAEKPYDNE